MKDRLPDNLNADAFLNPDQKGISTVLQKVEAAGRLVIDRFNPDTPANVATLSLQPEESMWRELWTRDPNFTSMQYANMLHRLGLSETPLMPGSKRLTAQYYCNYPENGFAHVWQFHTITRSKDEMELPARSMFWMGEGGVFPVEVTLLSHDSVSVEMAATKRRVEEGEEGLVLNHRLETGFGISARVLEHFGVTFQEKKDMIAAYDDIEGRGIDLATLHSVRDEVVGSMLGRTDFTRWLVKRRPNIEEVFKRYEQHISQVETENGMDDQASTQLLKHEQLLRLSTLSRFVSKKRRMTVDIGAVVGGTVGLVRLASNAYENSRRSEFSEEEATQGAHGLRNQLIKEMDLFETLRPHH